MKDIYKKEMPKKEQLAMILPLMKESRIPILVILGTLDRWNEPGKFSDDVPSHITVEEIPHGHYPHISNPDLVASLTNDWMRNHYEQNKGKAPRETERIQEGIAV